jgi:hypothetical protein
MIDYTPKTFKGLVVIYAWELTGDEIGKAKQPNQCKMPKWCLRKDTGRIDYSEYYTQWVVDGTDKYVMFDIEVINQDMQEEVSNCGLEDVFKGLDFRPFLEKFNVHGWAEMCIPLANYLTVERTYSYDFHPEGGEWDMAWGEVEHLFL